MRTAALMVAMAAVTAVALVPASAPAQVPTWVRGDREVAPELRDFRGSPLNLVLLFVDTTAPGILNADGEYDQPWTRVTALKDLYHTAWLVDIYPHLRLSVVLRPSTLEEIEAAVNAYDRWIAAGKPAGPIAGLDRWLRLSLTPVEALTPQDRLFIVQHFFDVPVRDVFKQHPAFGRLQALRGNGEPASLEAAVKTMGDGGIRDLIGWFNLTILDPDFHAEAITLQGGEQADFRRFMKQDHFSAEDIATICDSQVKVLRALAPQFRALQEAGRLEVATAPYYDPVLPLLIDPAIASRRGGASLALPATGSALAGEAAGQLGDAAAQYRRLFGRAPAGIWLGSAGMEPAVMELVAEGGFSWAGADAVALRGSARPGRPRIGERTRFAVHEVMSGGRKIPLIFEDPEILKNFGPEYGKETSLKAANMFMIKLYQQQALQADFAVKYLCAIVLPIESEWRHFEQDGNPFLHSIIKQMGEVEWIHLVTVSSALSDVKERKLLRSVDATTVASPLYPQWIGAPAQNAAWKQLAGLRRAIDAAKPAAGNGAAEAERLLRRAEGRDLLAALGSKGPEAADADAGFRGLLSRAWSEIGSPVPAELGRPMASANRAAAGGSATAASP